MSPTTTHFDLAILGAGAAGMMAAIAAAEPFAAAPIPNPQSLIPSPPRIALFEKNPRPGIKVLVCGGGRCNFTNAGTTDDLIAAFGRNGRFLTPALRHLDNQALRDFFDRLGVPSHVEPGGKVYPDSNQARSVVDALVKRIHHLGVQVFSGPAGTIATLSRYSQPTTQNSELRTPNFLFSTAADTTYTSRFLLLAVGGMSYQRMGTVGDGYRFATSLGHTIVQPRPAIVGLIAQDPWIKDLQGLAVRHVQVTIPTQDSRLKTQTSAGDLLFTHFGLSGPAILNPSEIVAQLLESSPAVTLHVDFLPRTSHDAAHATLRQWQQHHGKKRLRIMLADPAPEILITTTNPDQTAIESPETAIENHKSKTARLGTPAVENPLRLPARLAVALCQLEQIPPDQPCATLTSAQIHRLVERLKRCPFTITATRGFAEAMVTAGGIALREVTPHTLESKIVPHLFLAGELLDLTGPSGGYNLQLAFSTAHLAGTTIAQRLAADLGPSSG